MKLNAAKCKAMQISFLRTNPPPLQLRIDDTDLEIMTSIRLLGVIIQDDLRWDLHVRQIISNASRRLFILNKLKRNGVMRPELVTIYKMYIRPLIEFAVPVWASSITCQQSSSIERVQKRALRIIAWPNVLPYIELLKTMNVSSLKDRRSELVEGFARSLLKSKRHRHFLPETRRVRTGLSLRNAHHLEIPRTRTKRYQQSPIPHFVQLLNSAM